jgi:hypothetical protein
VPLLALDAGRTHADSVPSCGRHRDSGARSSGAGRMVGNGAPASRLQAPAGAAETTLEVPDSAVIAFGWRASAASSRRGWWPWTLRSGCGSGGTRHRC